MRVKDIAIRIAGRQGSVLMRTTSSSEIGPRSRYRLAFLRTSCQMARKRNLVFVAA